VQVRLHHYFGAWQPPLILLLTLAAGKLARQGIMGGIFVVLFLAPFAYLGVETVKAVSQVQPGPNPAVAKHLEDTGHDRGPILVQDLVLMEYLPKAQLFDKPEDAQGEEIDAVIMDSDSYKPRHKTTTDYLAANTDKFEFTYTISKETRSRFELTSSEAGNVKVYSRRSDG
jgi:hypothetical protein